MSSDDRRLHTVGNSREHKSRYCDHQQLQWLITTATATDVNITSALIVNISGNTKVVLRHRPSTTETVCMVLNAAGTQQQQLCTSQLLQLPKRN
jgi:hypothetical protein